MIRGELTFTSDMALAAGRCNSDAHSFVTGIIAGLLSRELPVWLCIDATGNRLPVCAVETEGGSFLVHITADPDGWTNALVRAAREQQG